MKNKEEHREPIIYPKLYSPIENAVIDSFKVEMNKMLVDVTKIMVTLNK